MRLDKDKIALIVKEVANLCLEKYVIAETAKQYAETLLVHLEEGFFDKCLSNEDLAQAIESLLFGIYPDLHLKLRAYKSASRKQAKSQLEFKWMDEKTAYWNIKAFSGDDFEESVSLAAQTYRDACNIILDLRVNRGGDPELIQTLSSYFFKERVWLNSLYFRYRDKQLDYFTDPSSVSVDMSAANLYVLVSNDTFSGGEECANNFKQLNRAQLIGERTKGAAHPAETFVIQDSILLYLPVGKAINPVTKDNWEGKGIEPDIDYEPENALKKTLNMICKNY